MSDASGIHIPTTGAPIGADLDGFNFKKDWEYASIVGMLMFGVIYMSRSCIYGTSSGEVYPHT